MKIRRQAPSKVGDLDRMWCELLTKTKLFKTVMKWKSSWSAAEVLTNSRMSPQGTPRINAAISSAAVSNIDVKVGWTFRGRSFRK